MVFATSTTYVVKANPRKVNLSLFGLYDSARNRLTLTMYTPKQLEDLYGIVLEFGEIEPSEEAIGGKK